jgi:hypothetical protein
MLSATFWITHHRHPIGKLLVPFRRPHYLMACSCRSVRETGHGFQARARYSARSRDHAAVVDSSSYVQQPLCPKTLPHLGRQLTHSVRANIPGHACPKADVSGNQPLFLHSFMLNLGTAAEKLEADLWQAAIPHAPATRSIFPAFYADQLATSVSV